MTDYIDIGVNLTGRSFQHDLGDVLKRAQTAGVHNMIVTGTDISHSAAAIELCKQYPDTLYATAGVHPHHAGDFDEHGLQQLRQFCAHDSVVAVGECGLDYNRNYSSPGAQRTAFERQLQLAGELGMPVFLHQRDAHQDFVSMLRDYIKNTAGGVAHCFTGSTDQAAVYLDMGLYIGVTGWICDERRGADLQLAVREIPLDRVLLETDAPYLLPRDLKQTPVDKRRNEPCYLPHICAVVARHMNIEAEALAAASVANAKRLFTL